MRSFPVQIIMASATIGVVALLILLPGTPMRSRNASIQTPESIYLAPSASSKEKRTWLLTLTIERHFIVMHRISTNPNILSQVSNCRTSYNEIAGQLGPALLKTKNLPLTIQ